MFAYAAILALALTTLVGATITVDPLTEATSGGSVVLKWHSESGDPGVFSIQLVNVAEFRDTFAIANNVQRTDGDQELHLDLPLVPASDGYTIRLHEISDINNAYATSAAFYIGEQVSTSAELSSTRASSSSAASSSASGASGASGSSSAPASTYTPSSTSAFGVTHSNTNTASASSGSSSGAQSGSGSGSGSSAGADATSFNGGDGGDDGALSLAVRPVVAMLAGAMALYAAL